MKEEKEDGREGQRLCAEGASERACVGVKTERS